jgi:hypothetical protein
MFLLVCSILLIGVIGYLAQSIGLCLVRGVNEATNGKPLFLMAILLSGVLSWVSVIIAYYIDIPVPFISYQVSLWAVAGGLLFGLGAAFNNGCGVSTISRLARGHLAMLLTIGGWFLGWLILTNFVPSPNIELFVISPLWHFSVLVVVSVVVILFMTRFSTDNRKVWATMLMIGLIASIVFLAEPHWTPSSLLKDMSFSLCAIENSVWPAMSRFVLIIALIGGMLIAAFRANTFSLLPVGLQDSFKHLAAGTLMGIGAAIANGGNDTQLLLALPSFSPAGFTTVLFMLVGIFIGRKIVKA